jgi:hypothetical protein
LLAQGAGLHAGDASKVVADLPDGGQVAYTDAPECRQDETLLLVAGSAAATQLIADIEARSQFGALQLAPAVDAYALAARFASRTAQGKSRAQRKPDDATAAPRQERGLTLQWEKLPARIAVSRPWEQASVEVEYRIAGRDHLGRIADTVRIVADPAGGAELPALDLTQAGAATPAPFTLAERDRLMTTIGHMDARLRPGLEAAARFLRLRSEAEYRRRIETASGIAERARRERPEEGRQIEQALKREIAALAAVFAVEVDCTVVAAWAIHSPMADVAYHLPGGATVKVTLDLGRATAEPLTCAACQRATRTAVICANAHILCLSCRDLSAEACALCAGALALDANGSARGGGARRVAGGDASGELNLGELARLSPALWRACVGWFLEQQGYTLHSIIGDAPDASWRGAGSDDQPIFIRALGGDALAPITEREVAETARRAHEQGLERALLLASGLPTRTAQALAASHRVSVIDGPTLRARLAGLAESADRQEQTAQAEMKTRARAAISAHAAMQKSLASAIKGLGKTVARPRVVGSATLAKARDQLRAARISANQAILAWETLLADWLAAFGTAPTHDGSLPLLADASEFASLRERAAHLGTALASVLREMASTPPDGEMGYDAWRAAVIEETRLRCSALEARLRIVEPAQWASFDAARDPAYEIEAEEAERAARHASARADKAQSQVVRLAG